MESGCGRPCHILGRSVVEFSFFSKMITGGFIRYLRRYLSCFSDQTLAPRRIARSQLGIVTRKLDEVPPCPSLSWYVLWILIGKWSTCRVDNTIDREKKRRTGRLSCCTVRKLYRIGESRTPCRQACGVYDSPLVSDIFNSAAIGPEF